MKRQYFGDELDFMKYAFLRAFIAKTDRRLGVVWMLTEDDDTDHGKRRRYLGQPEAWRHIDSELFDLLLGVELSEHAQPEESLRHRILPGSEVLGGMMPLEKGLRREYFQESLRLAEQVGVVFFDPDTGLAPASTSMRAVSPAHVHLNELVPFYQAEKALVIFQHYPRIPRPFFRKSVADRLRLTLGAPAVAVLGHRHGLFAIVPRRGDMGAAAEWARLGDWAARRDLDFELFEDMPGELEGPARAKSSFSATMDFLADTATAGWTRARAGAEASGESIQRAAAATSERIQEELLGWIDEGIASAVNSIDPPPEGTTSKELISTFEKKNALISGGFNLVPGPWGAAAALPEIALVLKNQVQMVIALARLNQRADLLSREVVLALLCSSSGLLAGGIVVVHGQNLLIKRASLRAMQSAIALLAGRVTQRAIQGFVAKWVPVLGALAMATWTAYWTRKIGRNAELLFSTGELAAPEDLGSDEGTLESPESPRLQLEALLALAWADGDLAPREREWISNIMEKVPLEARDRAALLLALDRPLERPAALGTLKSNPADAVGLMLSLTTLAQRDGAVRETEREFLVAAAREMGLNPADFPIPTDDDGLRPLAGSSLQVTPSES